MKFENEIFQKIWDLALPYQDKRDDKGHAEETVRFAAKLAELEGADFNVAIPAAILHDVGWSKVPKEESMLVFGKVGFEEKVKIQEKHEKSGVELAKEILAKIDYSNKLVPEILEIISQHDTRKGFISKNEGVVRDADKIGGRFTKRAFSADLERWDQTAEERIKHLKEKYLALPDFLYSSSAREIANEELEHRRREFTKEK